jgi:hypothetical protein
MPRALSNRELAKWRKFADALARRGRFAEAATTLDAVLERVRAEYGGTGGQSVERILDDLVGVHLRWAEEENCIDHHNPDSCLLPIVGSGVHAEREHVQEARDLLRERLAMDPASSISRWLLNVTAMALGDYPDGVAPRMRISPSMFAPEHDVHRFKEHAGIAGVDADGISGGVAAEDFDRDGRIDVVVSSMGARDQLRFYWNRGGGQFKDRSDSWGVSGQTGGLNLLHADYDNDAYADVLVLRGAWLGRDGQIPNSLLRNDGGESFVDVTESAGLLRFRPTLAAAWGDVDNDGWLDLFVGNESTTELECASELQMNGHDGKFVDQIMGSGVDVHSHVKGCAFGDYDEDGWVDLFVARRGGRDSLYRNVTAETPGRPTFEDATVEAGLTDNFDSFTSWFFDYDEDGALDLFVAAYAVDFSRGGEDRLDEILEVRTGNAPLPRSRNRLYRNLGAGRFVDVARETGLDRVVMTMGANYGDIDGDGWLDMYLGTGAPSYRALMANRALRNDEGRRFQDVTTAVGLGHLQKGHGIAFADFDGDGDEDIYAVLGGAYPADKYPNALFVNPGGGERWITLRFESREGNRLAMGAHVRLGVGTPGSERVLHRVVGTGGSFGSSSLQLEVGLGQSDAVDWIEVRWPGKASWMRFESPPVADVLLLSDWGTLEVVR